MPIEVSQVMNHQFTPIEYSWDEDRVILYHLGIGAGADWLNADELRYTYEKNLQVLPSFGVLASHSALVDIVASRPLAEVNKNKVVHVVTSQLPEYEMDLLQALKCHTQEHERHTSYTKCIEKHALFYWTPI